MNDNANERQRIATWLAFLATLTALAAGAILRNNIEGTTVGFIDSKAGITLRYPINWLLSRGDVKTDYIMRVEDPASLPFKTTLQISLLTTGPDATINDITELLNIRRAAQLSSYKSLEITPTTFLGRSATQMTYAYASTDTNPSLKSLPVIVRGLDIITVSRGQTYVITFLSDATSYEQNLRYLDLFTRRLEIQN
jgi:hypothetical protein